MARDPAKDRAKKQRYLERKKIAKYGPEAAGVSMTGRHGNHAKGPASGRWNTGRIVTSHGYVARRVGKDHPHAWGPPGSQHLYAYEHVLVMMEYLGRPLDRDEVVHHRNGERDDNRLENLELTSPSEHAREHTAVPGVRDALGRFAPGRKRTPGLEEPSDLQVREMPARAT